MNFDIFHIGPGSGLQQAMSDGLQSVMISCFTLMLFSQAERVAKRSAEEESEERFLDQTFNSGGIARIATSWSRSHQMGHLCVSCNMYAGACF